ncbi:MAG: hypothetical protein IPK73_30255 [Candidatus Obscuribacter sp.]|nr:hypothetical protein [Candidatus Obscuribacter sp.]
MKTISVKQAAAALGLSPRAIQYKLQNGDLKGTRSKNQYGKSEWRVWPTKDIIEALQKTEGGPSGGESQRGLNFEVSDSEAIDAEEVSFNEEEELSLEPGNWRQVEMERLELMAEKLVKPLAERIENQALALREQERIIEDQRRQLRLLPDFQKQADEERKAAELKALEVEALNKQVRLLEQEKSKTAEELAWTAEEKRRLEEKANEAIALANDLASLRETVEKLQAPWWKRALGLK